MPFGPERRSDARHHVRPRTWGRAISEPALCQAFTTMTPIPKHGNRATPRTPAAVATKSAPAATLDYTNAPPAASGRAVLRHRFGPMPKPVTLRATIETGPQAARFRVLSLTRTRADGTAIGSAPSGGPLRVQAGEVLEIAVEHTVAPTMGATGMLVVTGGIKSVRVALRSDPYRRILLLVDGNIDGRLHATYTPGIPPADDAKHGDFFTYSHVTRTLSGVPGYRVARAHRDTDTGDPSVLPTTEQVLFRTDFPGFRFDGHDLAQYDQIWLFGTGNTKDAAAPSDPELAALARFMDGGGGVFATGDHEDIGAPLGSKVLRVRAMRAWHFPEPGPDGEPKAPPAIKSERHDTTQPGAGEVQESDNYRFDDQSDDRPQPITLTAAGERHPLLELPGARRLRILPDHMHEGEVIDPFALAPALSPTRTYGGQAFTEFPSGPQGQPRPENLALATVSAGHATRSTEPNHVGADPATTAGTYGAIGAYDGHGANVGRVVVQSTFHHFTDVNLIGDLWAINADGTPNPERRRGFLVSPEGKAHLDDISVYFANIAKWISRP